MNDLPAISTFIWDAKYRFKASDGGNLDISIDDTWMRVARALAQAEPVHNPDTGVTRELRQQEFFKVMSKGYFSPAGRIISGAGTGRNVTLSNCLSGSTLILTAEYGVIPIGEIVGETVHVLDGNGHWIEAPINSFGEQYTGEVVLRGGYNGRVLKVIRATENHRWILDDGREVLSGGLEAGDQLKFVRRRSMAGATAYRAGVLHGIIYGDGSQRPEGDAKLRLCGRKVDLLRFVDPKDATITRRDDGDIDIYLGRPRATRFKELPDQDRSVEYLTGFLHGWMATDGCVSRGKAVLSCGAAEADWIRRYGPVAGMEVSSVTKLGDTTNYGPRNKTLFNVHFHRWTMNSEDLLLAKHREAFSAADYPWTVVSVGEFDTEEPVFCPRVTTTDSVQLDLGIHTGQCFTMGTIPDSMDGIFTHLKEAALTMQQGGGIGYDFSTLRPRGAEVKGVAADASGPLTFMDVWDAMCRTVMSAGERRGAMMATMRCDHPDIEAFIEAKRDPARLRMFNLSVLVTDAFMQAVKDGLPWRLHFENRRGETTVERIVDARALWDKIMRSTYDYAEPGVIFIDRVNRDHNLGYLETIATTNPCGEKPMGPYASCLLGSINLAKMITAAFSKNACLDLELLRKTVRLAIRMMDNVIEVGRFPLEAQLKKAKDDRQLGLGVTGLADALIMCGLTYGSDEAVAWTEDVMGAIALEAYAASCDLAEERGAFPTFNAEEFLKPERFAGRMLPSSLQARIRETGIRNGLLLSIAPTGTISLFAGNVSSGIEPVFAYHYTRKVLQGDGTKREEEVEDYAYAAYRKRQDDLENRGAAPWSNGALPPYFVSAQTLPPEAHVKMQAAAQKWVDSSISKTVNVPEGISFEDFKAVYEMAYDMGCKGCTTYRPNEITGSILSVEPKKEEATEPEADTHDIFGSSETHFRILNDDGSTILEGVSTDVDVEFWPEGDGRSITAVLSTVDLHLDPPETDAPQKRPDELPGTVYKLKWPASDHAIYVTITDIIDPATGRRRPFEVFINSKNMEHFAWTVALTRMISAIFRRPHGSTFVVEELKAVFDPNGGAWVSGKFVPSILAAIGGVIEKHMKAIGYIAGPAEQAVEPVNVPTVADTMDKAQLAALGALRALPTATEAAAGMARFADAMAGRPGPSCQKCGSFSVKAEGGCFQCLDCGHSKCG